ncbi:MAG: hypothetical protein ACFCGT_16840 [Sandaracinaceae bacterium]
MTRLGLVVLLVWPAATAAGQAQPAPEPSAELSLLPMEEGGPFRYVVSLTATGGPADVVADRRLLAFDLTVEGRRRPVRCTHPEAPRRVDDARVRRLSAGETWTEWVDLRMYCWGRELAALRSGATIQARYGFGRRGRGRWVLRAAGAEPDRHDLRELEGPTWTVPAMPDAQTTRRVEPRAGFDVAGDADPDAPPGAELGAGSEAGATADPGPAADATAAPGPSAHAAADPGRATDAAVNPGTAADAAADPGRATDATAEAASPPDDAATPPPPSPVDVTMDARDVRRGTSLVLRVAVRAHDGRVRAYVRPDSWTFRVLRPDGASVRCGILRGGGSPPPDLFAHLSERRAVRHRLDASFFCPDGTFEDAGIYEVTPKLRLDRSGDQWDLDAVTGRFVGPTVAIRVRRGPSGYVEQHPPSPEGDAPPASPEPAAAALP